MQHIFYAIYLSSMKNGIIYLIIFNAMVVIVEDCLSVTLAA